MSLAIFSKIIKASFNRRTNRDINNGDCYHWALLAKEMFPEALLCSNGHHAWIKLEDKYYDSEHPRGVKNHAKLKCNIRCRDFRIDTHHTFSEFKRLWDIRFDYRENF